MTWFKRLDQLSPVSPNETSRGAILRIYRQQAWRASAVLAVKADLRRRLKVSPASRHAIRDEVAVDVSSILVQAGLFEVAENLSPRNDENDLVARWVATEATTSLFCDSPTLKRWDLVAVLSEPDADAFDLVVAEVRRRTEIKPGLTERIRQLSAQIVGQAIRKPHGMTDRPNAADLAEHARQWRQNPSLLELWWGVRAAQYLRPFRSDHLIFDLLFATDISFAAQLLESYPSPLEPKLIFDLGWHGPRSSFAIWKGLMEAARLAFDADGDWNGCFLLPLLLRIAQDELGQEADEAERATVVDEVRRVLFQRSDGPPAALRWGAWLFRTSMRRLNRSQHEPAAGKESAPDWRLTEALFKSPQAGIWQQTQPRDCPAEEEWCLAAMRILAANCHDIVLPHIDLLAEALPREPEAFLDGPDGARLRELPSLFVHLDGRPDGLGFRILALPLVSVAAKQFSALWQQTLALREIVEHRTLSFDEGDAADDAARPASEMIQAVLSVGLCLVDLVQTPANTVSSGNPHTKTLSLLRTLHEATSEMLAIDPVRARNWELLHDHLCARRLLYEERSTVASGIAAPLKRTDQPTLGELLASRLGLSLSFLNCLRTLRANGVEVDRIREELAAIGVDFELLLRQIAQHDAIEATRKIDPEHFLVPPQER